MKRQDHGHRWTDKELRKMIGLWMQGVDTAEIATRMKKTISALNKMATRLRNDGIPLPRKTQGHKLGRSNTPWTQEEVEYLVRRRNDRISAEQIGVELGRTFCAVQAMILKLRQEGVAVPMLGSGVRRLWNPDRLRHAIQGRELCGPKGESCTPLNSPAKDCHVP